MAAIIEFTNLKMRWLGWQEHDEFCKILFTFTHFTVCVVVVVT